MVFLKILNNDAMYALKGLSSDSVDCVVTSPPYFGLRDYGTAKWEGGDANCDHLIPKGEHDPKRGTTDAVSSHTIRFNRTNCHKCGAKRIDAQIGLEKTPEEYVAKLVTVFREVRRVLKKEGTCWLVLGDSYAGSGKGAWDKTDIQKEVYVPIPNGPQTKCKAVNLKPKDLVGIPWRVAFALQADGWWLRQDIIWSKPNPMPESVTDRCTKAHEYIFLLTKSKNYYFDNEAIKEPCVSTAPAGNKGAMNKGRLGIEGWEFDPEKSIPEGGRNRRSVWTVNTKPYKGAHFATFPMDLVEPMVKAGCPKDGVVLDPFAGSGTTLQVAKRLGRSSIGIELNPDYIPFIKERVGWGDQNLAQDIEYLSGD